MKFAVKSGAVAALESPVAPARTPPAAPAGGVAAAGPWPSRGLSDDDADQANPRRPAGELTPIQPGFGAGSLVPSDAAPMAFGGRDARVTLFADAVFPDGSPFSSPQPS